MPHLKPETAVLATTWLLRLVGAVTCTAFLAVLFPLEWMAAIHRALGLGNIPQQPIFEYLARSLSAMYFAHGVFVCCVSTDVVRFRPLVGCIGGLNVILGIIFLGTDIAASMPVAWTLLEGPPVSAVGLLLVWLWRQLPSESHSKLNSDAT